MKELITYPLNDVDYSAEDAGLFHCTRTSGVWHKDSFPITVSGADNTVTIGKGLAWFSNDEFWGKVAAQKTVVELDLEYADPAYDRIDVIALQFDANKNATNLIVKKGEAKTNPTIPAISRTEALYELYLYAITRPAASVTIASSNVRDLRLDDEYCGLMADSVTSLDFPIVPIEKGGTDAATPEEALANLGGISKTLLWINASAESDFGEQTIDMDLSQYDFIEVHSVFDRNLSRIPQILIPIESNGSSLYGITHSSGIIIGWRRCYTTTTLVKFDDNLNYQSDAETVDNSRNIPIEIYGIKGCLKK